MFRPSPVVQASDGVLRGRGLVITDEAGRARVLVGAPLPDTKDRKRRDNAYEAMVFLDEQGHDRISLGQEMPAQINGVVSSEHHRIAPGYGFVIDDQKGNERGGLGFLNNGRALISLDRPNGDSWTALVDDKIGFAGTVSTYDRSFGENVTGVLSGTQGKRAFVDVKDLHDRPRAELGVDANGKPALRVLDENGKVEQDLLASTQR
ncbi:hypothetical protein [Acidipila sp. EB88]|uniref:hypothetical protein n=1 Tax=Acidipila sp. EB88 TaxID=2305226 RepID=UPI000F5DE58C|nr:hypothetical protein [Acidipila sp. EB88]